MESKLDFDKLEKAFLLINEFIKEEALNNFWDKYDTFQTDIFDNYTSDNPTFSDETILLNVALRPLILKSNQHCIAILSLMQKGFYQEATMLLRCAYENVIATLFLMFFSENLKDYILFSGLKAFSRSYETYERLLKEKQNDPNAPKDPRSTFTKKQKNILNDPSNNAENLPPDTYARPAEEKDALIARCNEYRDLWNAVALYEEDLRKVFPSIIDTEVLLETQREELTWKWDFFKEKKTFEKFKKEYGSSFKSVNRMLEALKLRKKDWVMEGDGLIDNPDVQQFLYNTGSGLIHYEWDAAFDFYISGASTIDNLEAKTSIPIKDYIFMCILCFSFYNLKTLFDLSESKSPSFNTQRLALIDLCDVVFGPHRQKTA